ALAPFAFRCGLFPTPRIVRLLAVQTATSPAYVWGLISMTSPSLAAAAAWLGRANFLPGPTDRTRPLALDGLTELCGIVVIVEVNTTKPASRTRICIVPLPADEFFEDMQL